MQLISDVFLGAGAFGAAFYCFILQQRLSRFARLEGGMGSAIAVLSAQVDDLTRALNKAQSAATGSTRHLEELTARAAASATRLELLLSTLHDLPDPEGPRLSTPQPAPAAKARVQRYRIRPLSGVTG